MWKFLVVAMSLLMILVVAVPVAADTLTADLVIGKDAAVTAGTVDVNFDSNAGNIVITYSVDPASNGGWSLTEAHVYVGTSAPSKSSPGQFPYTAAVTDNPNTWTCTIPVSSESGQIYIAAHAALTSTVTTPNPVAGEPPIVTVINETSWAKTGSDYPIPPGKNWATYFTFSVSGNSDPGNGGSGGSDSGDPGPA
jgi:hypothetical protein